MNKFYVYTITSIDSGEVLYVGKGSGFRWKTSLKRIETISNTQCEAFLEETDSNELALQKETKLIQSLAPKYNKNVSWRKIKEGTSGITKIAFKFPFTQQLVENRRTAGGFLYELVQIGIKLFKLMVTKVVDGAYTASFTLSTKRQNQLYVTTNATGVIEPSAKFSEEHHLVHKYFDSAVDSVENALQIFVINELVKRSTITWYSIKLMHVSNRIKHVDSVINYFTGICGRIERSRTEALYVGKELGFEFKESKNSIGISFRKLSGKLGTFTLSMYQNQDDTLSILGTVYPRTFMRGKSNIFRSISGFNSLENKNYIYKLNYIRDAKITVSDLKLCLGEMYNQLGLHLIISAPKLDEITKSVMELALPCKEQILAAELWTTSSYKNKFSSKNLSGRTQVEVAKLVSKVKIHLGFDMYSISPEAFIWIRNAFFYSQLTKEETKKLALLNPESDIDNDTLKHILLEVNKRVDSNQKSFNAIRDTFWMLSGAKI